MFKNWNFGFDICLLLGICALGFALPGCGGTAVTTTPATVSGASISGKVFDKNGIAASGVKVYLRSSGVRASSVTAFATTETTSGTDGSFSFSGVSDGTYNVQADQSDQYKVMKQNVVISGGVSVDLGTLAMAETGAITGSAFFADKDSHLGIDVFIPGTSFTAKTAADGSFTILYIPAGTFEVFATYTAYQNASLETVPVVSASTTTTSNLILYPEAGGTYGGVSLEVRDMFTGDKLPTVEVTIGHVSKTTDSNGLVSFDRVWAASQAYSASKEGWRAHSGAITVTANATVSETIWITKESFTITTWGSSGTGEGQFTDLYCLSIDLNDNVFVTEYDTGTRRIQKFSRSGSYLTKWSTNTEVTFGIATDSTNNVYVANRSTIRKYDNNGGLLLSFGSGVVTSALGIAIAPGGSIYVTDGSTLKPVQKFDSSGNFQSKFGSDGSGDGQFNAPMDIAIDSSGNVFVSDRTNRTIQKFDNSGNFLSRWGSAGTGNGQFGSSAIAFILGICVDGSGNIYVADTGNNRIQKFDNNGNFLTKWGSSGTGNGQFADPIDVAVDSGGRVHVSESGNSRIQKFSQ